MYEDLVAFATPYLDSGNEANQPTFARALRIGSVMPANSRNSPQNNRSGTLSKAGSDRTGTPNSPPADGPNNVNPDVESPLPSKSSTSLAAINAAGVASPRKKVRDPKTGKGSSDCCLSVLFFSFSTIFFHIRLP